MILNTKFHQKRTIFWPFFGCEMHIKGRDIPNFSYFNQQRKISKFGDVTTIDVHFTVKIRPKNSPILMKLGIYNQHTSNQKRTKSY